MKMSPGCETACSIILPVSPNDEDCGCVIASATIASALSALWEGEVLRIISITRQHWPDRHGLHISRTKQTKSANGSGHLAATGGIALVERTKWSDCFDG